MSTTLTSDLAAASTIPPRSPAVCPASNRPAGCTSATTSAPSAPCSTHQTQTDSTVMIADLHALTVEHDPAAAAITDQRTPGHVARLRRGPAADACYVQSDVPEHAELHYLLECATGYGEAARMIQFRQKAAGPDPVRLSLLTYPVLMAADILLHDADEVPVGDDQSQHLELARDVANRFNTRYGQHVRRPPRGSSAGGRPGDGPRRPHRQDGQVIHCRTRD